MTGLPELVPISDLRTRQAEVLASLSKGPVILTQHSRAAAVLLSTDEYNAMVARLEACQDGRDAREARRGSRLSGKLDEYLAKRDDFWKGSDLGALLEAQGVYPVEDLDNLGGGWPKDESTDEFVAAIREWRRQSPAKADLE